MDEGMFRPRFAGQAAYITPPVAPYHAGPAGMVYNPGTALGARWRNTFLVSSFAGTPTSARVWALTLRPDGAGFALASDTTVVQGILTVGMRFGPDGALYLADWIDGWDSKGKGRVWKLDVPAESSSPARREVRTLLAGDVHALPVDRLRALLAHADQRVRLRAQLELARRGDAAPLLAVARANDSQLARIHALWGLGQLARANAATGATIVPFLRDGDAEVRAQAARVLGDARVAAAADALVPLLKDDTPRARFFAAEALGRIAYAPAIPAIVQMLADADDRDVYLRQAGVTALARIGQAAPVAALASHPSRAVRLAAVVALRRLRSPELARFVDDQDELVVTEAARAINDEGSIAAALPALARALERASPTNTPLVRRAIAASIQLGTPEALARVAAFAGRDDRPDSLRAEAVATLGAWPAPSTMNRVDGAWLGPVSPRDPTAARAAVAQLLEPLLRSGRVPLQVAAIEAAGRLGIGDAAPALLAALRENPAAPVRVAALRALPSTGATDVVPAVRAALSDRDPSVRAAALGLVPSLGLSEDAGAEILASVVTNADATAAERQGALASLGRLPGTHAQQTLGALLDQLAAGTLAPELRVDLVDAVQGNAALRSRVTRYAAAKTGRELMAAYGEGLLRGGDARRGAQVVFQSSAAQCTRCHTIGQPGAEVGPPLTHIGGTLSREQLLQALLEPSARLAPGYGTVVLTLKDGKRVVGVLQRESDAELVVETAPGTRQRVPTGQVAKRENAPSPMPPMGAVLRPREIRDVVEFLAQLR
jgi:putative heme-binding domain-containing protein